MRRARWWSWIMRTGWVSLRRLTYATKDGRFLVMQGAVPARNPGQWTVIDKLSGVRKVCLTMAEARAAVRQWDNPEVAV